MTTFAQTSQTHDIIIAANGKDFATVSGIEAYAHVIEDVIRTLRGEIQLDLARGIDYEGTVWTNTRRLAEWKRQVQKVVKNLPFVVRIQNLEASVGSDGILRYSLTVETDIGSATVAN